ncbi:MAG TPA: Npt1/Npt2 family nucleotide transporter, partial [Herpetosiphonaceae bacterium]|nr:Npt1/Npt2 family nucleotide transporter [Herpetosiphonaceae bacterium]
MKGLQKLAPLLNVYPDEGRIVAVLLAHSLCAGVGQTLTQTAGFSLFLSEYSIRLLPFVYFGVTVAAVTVTLAMLHLQRRVSFSSLMLGAVGLIVVVLIAFRVALGLPGARWVAIALPIWYRVMYALMNVEFWGVAGRLFNVRQGKRLFGLIASGEVTGSALSGLATPLLVTAFGTSNLLVVAILAMLGALVSLFYITRAYAAQLLAPTEPDAPATVAAPSGSWWRTRYIGLIFIVSALVVVNYLVVDNIFLERARAQFPDAASLASFLGVYEAILGFTTLIATVFITGRFLSRYGVRAGLLAQPVMVLAGCVLVLSSHMLVGATTLVFVFVTLTRVLTIAGGDALTQPTIGLLYQPLRADLRLRAQTAAGGIVPALAACFAAGVLVLFNTVLGFTAIQLTYVLLVFLLAWLLVALALNREYAPMLLQALTRRRLDAPALVLDDPSSIEVLRKTMAGPHPEAVIYALHALEASGLDAFVDFLPGLLVHPEPQVRREALRAVEQHHLEGLVPVLAERLTHEPDARVKGALLRTLAALSGDTGRDHVLQYLSDADPETRLGALTGLLRSGGIEGVLLAGTQLLELARSTRPGDRALAARVLGEVGIPTFYQLLVPLLQDQAPEVRAAALAAAGKIKAPQLWPLVVADLGSPETRAAAVAALVAGGAAVLPDLRALMLRSDQPRDVLIRAARISGRIRGHAAITLLEEHLARPDPVVREQVLLALSRCRYHAEGAAAARVWSRIEAELDDAAWTMAALAGLGTAPELELVQRALDYRFQQSRSRLLLLLSFIFDARSILRTRDTLAHGPDGQRAVALEVLDILIVH